MARRGFRFNKALEREALEAGYGQAPVGKLIERLPIPGRRGGPSYGIDFERHPEALYRDLDHVLSFGTGNNRLTVREAWRGGLLKRDQKAKGYRRALVSREAEDMRLARLGSPLREGPETPSGPGLNGKPCEATQVGQPGAAGWSAVFLW